MKYSNIANGPRNVSRILLGCMRMPSLSVDNPDFPEINKALEELSFRDRACSEK